ncbi:hypothetical protein ABFS83_14G036600 [Erythranthe nasuta]
MGKVEEASPPPHVAIEISSDVESRSISTPRRRQILHRVPPQLRENKKHLYDPTVLSLGPYHHGGSQFRQTEKLKEEILNTLLDSNTKGLFHRKILERIDEIRYFYGGISTDEFDDYALAQMMIHDACFVLYCIEMGTKYDSNKNYQHRLIRRLGLYVVAFMFRDFRMLENQIPFWLIMLLIDIKINDKDEGEALLCTFLSDMTFGVGNKLPRVPWKDEEPLHLIEAQRITLLNDEEIVTNSTERRTFKFKSMQKKSSPISRFESDSNAFRSVIDLKAKGIHFRPSSYCLKDIRFNSYSFYGELYLPIWFVSNNSKVFFSNTIAFEMSPETDTDFDVASYINFMKALIENSEDVKELREKGILFSSLVNDEEVAKMFKEIDTHSHIGPDYARNLQDVKMRINEHCSSKAKTWMAELIHTYFRSPWTAIALLAAIFLLCLTFLQTFYTMNPL